MPKMILRRGHEYAKDEIGKKRIIIYKYTWPKRDECNIMRMEGLRFVTQFFFL